MPHANEIFFFVAALILWGLAASSQTLISNKKGSWVDAYWLVAIIFTALSFTCFAIAPSTQLILLSVANTFFVSAYLYLGLFCRSLSKPVPKYFNLLAIAAVLCFGLIFEYMRQHQTFPMRVTLVIATSSILLIWELVELRRLGKIQSIQLKFFIGTTIAELVLALARLGLLYFDPPPLNINLYQEPLIGSLLRWSWFAFAALSYISIIGYWIEKLSVENAKAKEENKKITELLKEKERLIYGLMKANKTAATGALSASIAHELNQPLGASNLNIQFLKMKLEKGVLNPELGKEILDSLEEDNQRAATIVKSLRSIFTEGESNAQEIQLGDLIAKVLDIIKPELKSKNIQIQLRVDDGLLVRVNSSEIEQVILNLLNNAIQALANSGTLQRRIAIEAIKADKFVLLSISDNGAGVPEGFKSQLFELLSTTKQTGMGLGLWLCKHIVTRYSGSIHYEDAVGGGAKFVIELPLN